VNLEKNPTTGQTIELFGPTVEFLTSPDDPNNDFCVMKGTIPPGAVVPLHAHADTEDFQILSGEAEGLRTGSDGSHWLRVKAGDFVHVPANAPHAWRNLSSEPVVMLMITTRTMATFFREVGRPLSEAEQPPTSEALARFAAISERYGYWNATPEENAAVGIDLSFVGGQRQPVANGRAGADPAAARSARQP
jgi:quercetin dioxygenase-like cupin family protein